jgi:hypothetical protein
MYDLIARNDKKKKTHLGIKTNMDFTTHLGKACREKMVIPEVKVGR